METLTPLRILMPPMLANEHEHQYQVAQDEARFQVVACGRRWGKTHLGIALATEAALKGGRAWWVAPSYTMAESAWRILKNIASQIPGAVIRETRKQITFPKRGTIQIRSADHIDSLRGEALHYCVLDECAFMSESAWTDAIRPALSDHQGRALFISTPNGRNWFWRLWQRGRDPAYPDWKSWRFPTSDNPYISLAEIDEAKRTLPRGTFRQEYQAKFLQGKSSIFRHVRRQATADPQSGYIGGHAYTIGIDWGKHNDFTCFAVIDNSNRQLVHLERINQLDYQYQLQLLKVLVENFRPELILAEGNSIGDPLIEQLQRDDLPVQPFITTASSKKNLIERLALAFERGNLRILDHPVLLAELEAYTTARTTLGALTYTAPPGMHDDTVIALALAWWAACTIGSPNQTYTTRYA